MARDFLPLLVVAVLLAVICVRGQKTQPCDKGVMKCINAPSRASDTSGEWQCCPAGYSMRSYNSNINGRQVRGCTCTRGNSGGFGSSMFVSSVQGDPTGFDFGGFEKRMRDWGQEFSTLGMRNHLRSMNDRLRRMISRISGLSRSFRLYK